MKQFVIDGGRNTGKLPHLPILENNFENPCVLAVCKRLDLRIEHRNVRNFQRCDKVLAVINLPVALAAENHDSHRIPDKCSVRQDPTSRGGFPNDFPRDDKRDSWQARNGGKRGAPDARTAQRLIKFKAADDVDYAD
jgi:hypothetical protein